MFLHVVSVCNEGLPFWFMKSENWSILDMPDVLLRSSLMWAGLSGTTNGYKGCRVSSLTFGGGKNDLVTCGWGG